VGPVEGAWDLRPGVDAYLGGVDVRGQRVVELGTADGYDRAFIGVLGFERTTVTTHTQLFNGRAKRLFTVVGHRTGAGP